MPEPSTWKTITVPKAVFFPTLAPDGTFKNSGIKVEPHHKVEIELGTHNLRVDGVAYQMFISCDSLRLDSNNCVVLDKPAPPVANISGGGEGRAYVGRVGTAQARAAGDSFWQRPHEVAANQAMPEEEAKALFEDGAAESPDYSAAPNRAFEEERVVRTIKLKDGSTAEVLIDPSTGREAGAVSRAYSGIGTNPKEAARLLAKQQADAQDVTFRPARPTNPAPPPQPRQEPVYKVAATTAQGTASGLGAMFDAFLAAVLGTRGFPQGTITFLELEPGLSSPCGTGMVIASTCETAFARLHKAPGVLIPLPDTKTPEVIIDLAEHLPVLAEVVPRSATGAALVLTAPWEHSLLTRLPHHHLRLTRHSEQPDRFLTATILRAHGQALATPKTLTFPLQ